MHRARAASPIAAGILAGILTGAACGEGAGGSGTEPPPTGGGGSMTGEGGSGAAVGGAGGSAAGSATGGGGAGGAEEPLCPVGSTLVAAPQACDDAPVPAPGALTAAVEAAEPGAIVALGAIDGNAVPCLPVAVCRPDAAPTLVFSDEPETVFTDGVLYAEILQPSQRYRVYTYHVNGGASPRKFPVVVLNQTDDPITLTVTKRGLAGPSVNYLDVGRQAALGWMQSAASGPIVVVPSQTRVLLDPDLDALHAGTDELVHAIYDLEASGPLKLSVVSVPAAADAATVTAGLSVVPSAGLHVRGTFPGADLDLVLQDLPDDLRHLRLGADEVDPDLVGTSFVDDNAPVTLRGNFGLRYRLLGIGPARAIVNPRAGVWAGVVDHGGGPLLVPSATLAVSENTTAAVVGAALGDPLTLITGGGSNLPIHLITW